MHLIPKALRLLVQVMPAVKGKKRIKARPSNSNRGDFIMLNEIYKKPLKNKPDKDAIIFKGQSVTYRQLDETTRQFSATLTSLGVGYGDRIALFMGNRPELIELYLACFFIGAVALPLNSRFQTDEVIYACQKSTPRLMIMDADRLPRIKELRKRLGFLEHLYVLDGNAQDDVGSWSQVLKPAIPLENFQLPDDPDHPALIIFTSGSTSRPKGVTHTHKSILATVKSREETQRLEEEDIILVGTLICHGAGSMGAAFPSIYTGGTILLLEIFDPEAWLESVKKYRPTRAMLLPAQLLDAVEHEKAQSVDFSSLKEVMVGGGMVSHDLYVQFRKAAGFELMEGYGLTECEGNCLPRYYELVKPGSVGKPRVGVEIRLADQAGNEVETGTIGEIWIKSDSVMAGYWEDPENTEKTYADGWLKTGDLALRDEDGYLYFTGRIKELIIKGGSNVSPGEVEEVLDDHPDIVISGVVGTADAHYGELIHAFVEMKAGLQTPATVEQLTRYASEKLAAYKVPDRWTILEKLPRNKVGKIDRASLHAMAAEIDV